MRFSPVSLPWLLGALALVAPVLRAQEPGPTPSTTQSQSGYPDVRREAADPTLFPDPDKAASEKVRPLALDNGITAGMTNKGAAKRGGLGRTNSQSLGQADTDPLPVRVAYRRAKTLAMERDPGLGVLLRQADLARTDAEKRQYLQTYYHRLFAEVRKIDPSPAMKSHLDSLQISTGQRYDPKRRAVANEEDLINGRLFGQPGLTR